MQISFLFTFLANTQVTTSFPGGKCQDVYEVRKWKSFGCCNMLWIWTRCIVNRKISVYVLMLQSADNFFVVDKIW